MKYKKLFDFAMSLESLKKEFINYRGTTISKISFKGSVLSLDFKELKSQISKFTDKKDIQDFYYATRDCIYAFLSSLDEECDDLEACRFFMEQAENIKDLMRDFARLCERVENVYDIYLSSREEDLDSLFRFTMNFEKPE